MERLMTDPGNNAPALGSSRAAAALWVGGLAGEVSATRAINHLFVFKVAWESGTRVRRCDTALVSNLGWSDLPCPTVLPSLQPRCSQPSWRTQPQIAASNGWVNGYAEVLFYNGKIGFVPSSQIKPYHSDLRPGSTCTVAGLRLDGSPAFACQ